jgi:hypothetical protein
MRAAFPERSPPAVAARSPAVRLPVRSPARGSLKRKATTPQQHIRPAVEQSPVSPLQSPKTRKLRREDCVSPAVTPAKSPHESPPERSSAASSSSTPPYMPPSPQLESIGDTSSSGDQVSLNYFQTHTAAVSLMSLKKSQHKIIIDSGASTFGTGIKSQLQLYFSIPGGIEKSAHVQNDSSVWPSSPKSPKIKSSRT